MSDTPRTDAAFWNSRDKSWMDGSLCRQLERELAEANAENNRLRAALANSNGACIYCSLPKDQWAACRSGFPGCARADDAMGCPELGARMELAEANARIARLDECIEVAWTLIANVSEGNWDKQRADWKDATVRWRDECLHPVLSDVYTRRAKEAKP